MKPIYEIVYIEWQDATSVDSWQPITDALKDKPHTVYSVGWLIREHKQHIVIALSIDPEGALASQYLIIPRKWVLKVLRQTAK